MLFSIPLMAVGVLGALWRYHAARTSRLTVQQDVWIEWLCWIAIYIGCRVHHWTRHKSPQDDKPRSHGKILPENFRIYALSAAGVGAQMLQFLGIAPSVLVSRLYSEKEPSTDNLAKPLVTLTMYLISLIAERRAEEELDVEELEELNERQPRKPNLSDQLPSLPRQSLFVPLGIISCLLLIRPIEPALFPITLVYSFLFLLGRIATFTFLPRMSKIDDLRVSVVGIGIDWDLLEKISLPSFAYLTLVLALVVPDTFKPSVTIFVCAAAEASWWLAITCLASDFTFFV
jgi:hypothetical protein